MDLSAITAHLYQPTLRAARVDARGMTVCAYSVKINDTFRLGAVSIAPETLTVAMSSASWSAVVSEHNRGGRTPVIDTLEKEIAEADDMALARMTDLSMKGPTKVVDRRRVTRYSDDRVDFICRGISDLVSQMSNLLSAPSVGDGQVSAVAKRYAELATEMRELREAVTNAEGMFEVAQQQVMQLMGDDR